MNKKTKVKEFIKTHKKQVAISIGVAATVVSGAVVCAVTKQKPKVLSEVVKYCGDLPIPEHNRTYGHVWEFWQERTGKKAIVDYDLSELGELAHVFEGVEGIKPHSMVTLTMEFTDVINDLND